MKSCIILLLSKRKTEQSQINTIVHITAKAIHLQKLLHRDKVFRRDSDDVFLQRAEFPGVEALKAKAWSLFVRSCDLEGTNKAPSADLSGRQARTRSEELNDL